MPGLNLNTRARLGFRASTPEVMGTVNTGTVDSAAFMPGATQQPQSRAQALSPTDSPGLAFWIGVGALIGLAIIRHTLPN